MLRPSPGHAALQVGEFVAGAAVGYVVVGASWALTGSLWAPVLLAVALLIGATALEARFGPRALGLVTGLVPAALVTAGLLAALGLVLGRLPS